MGERRRNAKDLSGLVRDDFLEFWVGDGFFDGEGMVALHTGEVVQALPDVAAFAPMQTDILMFVSDNQIVEKSGLDFCFFDF